MRTGPRRKCKYPGSRDPDELAGPTPATIVSVAMTVGQHGVTGYHRDCVRGDKGAKAWTAACAAAVDAALATSRARLQAKGLSLV